MITITGPPAGTFAQNGVTLVGTCTTGLQIGVSGAGVNQSSTADCPNGQFSIPIIFSAPDGSKPVTVTQVDSYGVSGSASSTFTRDTVAPQIAITGPAANTLTSGPLTLVGTCTNGINVQITGAIQSPPVSTPCNSGNFSVGITLSGPFGPETVVATQTDPIGNTGSSQRTFVLDIPPVIAITGPAAGTVAQTGVTLVGTCTTGVPITVSGTGVSQNSSATCTNGTFSTPITFSAVDGSKTVTVTQTDAFGGTGSATSTYVKDTTPPVIEIASPAAGTVTTSTIALTGTCETGLTVMLTGDITSMNTTCSNGQFSATVTLNQPAGSKTVIASQTDIAGNFGSDSRSFILDNPPTIAITGPASGTVAISGVMLTGTCTTGVPITVSGTGVNQSSTATCTSGAFSTPITFSDGTGSKAITVTQTDTYGLSGSASTTLISDTNPVITITGPAQGTIGAAGVTLVGTCANGLPIVVSGAGVKQYTNGTCANGTFSIPITFSGGTGTMPVTVTQTDSFGETGSASTSFIADTAPVVTITGPAAGTTTAATIALTGTCETGLTVNLSGGITSATTTCTSGQFAVTVTLTAPNGTKNVVASQTDSFGLSGSADQNFVLDVPPVIAITGPAQGTIASTGITLAGTCTSGIPIAVSGTGSESIIDGDMHERRIFDFDYIQ